MPKYILLNQSKMQKEKALLLCKQLREDGFKDDYNILEIVQKAKKSFHSHLGNIKLKSLIDYATDLLESCSNIKDNEPLLKYASSLVSYIGQDYSIDFEIFRQLKLIITELKRRNETLITDLADQIWMKLEKGSIICPLFAAFLADSSKSVFEKIVLSFFKYSERMNYFVTLSSDSPELFQKITSILNGILIRSNGNDLILKLISSFIEKVMIICQNDMKNYLGLYPNYCWQLVSLLFISPEFYSNDCTKYVARNTVLELIFNMYAANRKCVFMLLSHYQGWILPFNNYLANYVDEIFEE